MPRPPTTPGRWPSPTEESDHGTLPTVWFLLIAVLWTGYFVLEGFDFGVGMLLPVLGRTEDDRRVAAHTIGPVWDGNEVWLLVGRRRDLRRVPGVVRDPVLRLLPARCC